MLQYLVLVGALFNFFGSLPYLVQALKGENQPNKVSWGMWSIAPLIATAAALSAHVTWAVVPVFMSGFMPLLIFISSFLNKKAYWRLELFDYLCGAASALALILWAITKEPTVAVVFAIISDALAAVPTLVKGWQHPETETGFVFFAGLISALTAFAAIKVWTFPSYGFAVYLVVMNTMLFTSIWHLKIRKIFLGR
ncbi:hypothetical protein M1413_02510 [Patescibacteria group bacterium]|nr:hypothetical protein [Patescibacteria group bacterium]MCL5114696.1 hypothetical protein [Patescibacteria group bacterium]